MNTVKQPKLYELVRNQPVARFYYQGTHSHPIRRTVLVVEETDTHITGYEMRCGNEVRDVGEARKTVRTYRKDKIAKWGDYSRLRQSSVGFMHKPEESTLCRESIMTMFTKGA